MTGTDLTSDQVDRDLVERILEGDDIALRQLYERHLPALYAFLLRLAPPDVDAADLVQDTFIKAWENLKKYKADYRFKTWLFVIGKRLLFDQLKKKRPQAFSDLVIESEGEMPDFETSLVDPHALPDVQTDHVLLAEHLEKLLQHLSLKARESVVFHLYEGLTFQEIATLSKESIDTIKTRYRRTIITLRDLLHVEKKDVL